MNIDWNKVKEVVDKIDWDIEDGALVIYVGIVKGMKDGRIVREIEVVHDEYSIHSEINRKLKDDLENRKIAYKLTKGKLKPGDNITIIAVCSKDRYDATIKLLKILDIVKRNVRILEKYE